MSWNRLVRTLMLALLGAALSCAPALGTPAAPDEPYPADGASSVSPYSQLRWACESADQYEVYLGTTPDFLDPVGTVATKAFKPVPIFAPGHTYYWRIVALETGTGKSAPGPVWSFTTGTATNLPSNPNPQDGATEVRLHPTMTWDSDAAQWVVRFGTSETGLSQTLTTAVRSYSLSEDLKPGVQYFWQVTAIYPGGILRDGPVWTFTATRTVPPSPGDLTWDSGGGCSVWGSGLSGVGVFLAATGVLLASRRRR